MRNTKNLVKWRLFLFFAVIVSALPLQETFWRIPAKMSPTQLRRAAASLSQLEAEEEKLQPEGTPTGPGERAPVEEQQRAPRAEALQALMVARKQKAGPAAPEGNCVTALVLLCAEARELL